MSKPILRSNNEMKLSRFSGIWTKLKHLVIGKEANKGLIFKIFIYVILIDAAYIYIRPLIFMITTMLKNYADMLDPSVIWIPKSLHIDNLSSAWYGLKYLEALGLSVQISTIGAVAQVIFCALTGYAFARLKFPFKKFWFVCLLFVFIVPPQLIALPSYILFNELKLVNTIWPFLVPTLFGHGIRGALFVIIFRQFFSTQPKALEEAARMDGASAFKIFYRVMMPLALPAIVVVFLFSFVWHWNDTFTQTLYLNRLQANDVAPLSMGIDSINAYLLALRSESGSVGDGALFLEDEPIRMAASFLIIVPLIVLYSYAQRWFVEGVERTGIVE